MVARILDYRELALRTVRAEFVQACPWYFLVAVEALTGPRGRASTGVFEVMGPPQTRTAQNLHAPPPSILDEPVDGRDGLDADELTPVAGEQAGGQATLLVLAVRKEQAGDPSRITVGRASSNDIVIADADVSRTHAFFKVQSDYIVLGDAGSSNGTMINGKLLEPQGPTQLVIPGDRVRFALLEFEFLDAVSTWDHLHQLT